MKGFIFGFLIASVLFGGAFFIASKSWKSPAAGQVKAATKYYCPMHPGIFYDKPGDCPICGMKLVPVDRAPVHQDHDHSQTMPMEDSPQGYSTVRVTPDKLQLMGVSTMEARQMDMDESIRTTGRIVADETRIHHVHTKFEGYIEQVFANFTGQFVKKGAPLFSIYSPELLATQREYLLALKAKESMQDDATLGGIDLVESARQRLALWDIGPEQIEKMERDRQPIRALTINSPVSGYITAKSALHGTQVTPAESIYDIVDLSRVWVMADVYETNLQSIKIGTPVTVLLPFGVTSAIEGKVSYLDPVLDPISRTLKARIELPNPGTALKPEMFVTVVFGGTATRGLVVPESAVISTGERMIVFVQKGSGEFQPREVTIGTKTRGYYEIKSGVVAGDHVVVSGNFLLDSESRLRAAASGLSGQHQH